MLQGAGYRLAAIGTEGHQTLSYPYRRDLQLLPFRGYFRISDAVISTARLTTTTQGPVGTPKAQAKTNPPKKQPSETTAAVSTTP